MFPFNLFKRRPERNIFHYFDGRNERSIDPLRVYYALWSDVDSFHPAQDLEAMGELSASSDPEDIVESKALVDRVTAKVRDVFGVQDFDPETGHGLIVEEQLLLFGSFVVFMDAVKKKQDHLRSQWQPTESNALDEGGTKAPHVGLAGPADISEEQLDALGEQFAEAIPRATDSMVDSADSSSTDDDPSNESSAVNAAPVSPPPPAEKSTTRCASDSPSTRLESTPAAPSLSSKQLLELSTREP